MSTKEIKLALKEAREAIKTKDFKTAIKKCQEVIKKDKDNYLAFVLLGAAYQDTNKEDAAKCLRKAISKSDDHLLALQGLVMCAKDDELPDIYHELLELQPERCTEFHNKLISLATNLVDTTNLINLLIKETEIESNEVNQPRIDSAWKTLVQVLMEHPNAESDFLDKFEQALIITAKDVQIPKHSDRYRRLIPILYKKQKIQELIQIAESMSEMYTRDTFSIEWICKVHTEVPDIVEKALNNEINGYIERLLDLSPSSPIGLMSQAVKYYREGDLISARDVVLKAYEIEPNWGLCQNLLYKIYIQLRAYSSAEFIHSQIKGKTVDLDFVKCLIQQYDKPKALKAVEVCKELLLSAKAKDDQLEIMIWFAKALICAEQYQAAEKTIQKIESLGIDQNILQLLKCTLMANTGIESNQILNFLNDIHLDDSDFLLDIGAIYLNLNKPNEALPHLMASAKIAPLNSETFYYLGKAYNVLKDEIRCIKCLEKCIKLNFQNEKAVHMLSSIYRKNENWNSNVTLLQNSVKFCHGNDSKWAYFQLGLHFLARNAYDEAVNSFRSALRYETTDGVIFEGLADAYFSRGSYKSALKVYEKTIELCGKNNQYARLQVANIKRILNDFTEAIQTYDELLREAPEYLPALKGIAEAYLRLAKELHSNHRSGRAQINLQEGVLYFEKVIKLQPSFACVWRLIGSAFQFATTLPAKYATLDVPGSFVGTSAPYKKIKCDELMELSGRCYSRAIKINGNDHLLWHELAANYFYRYSLPNNTASDENKSQFLKLAEESAKHAIKLSPNTWENWNLLGVIVTSCSNYALAQHSFIQALNIEKRSAIAWTNLGLLYLTQGNIKLANKAFGKAQQSDTTFSNAWIGQSFIAEEIGETDEALDLFRHCTELEFNLQSALGYANRVCSVLDEAERLDRIEPKYCYVIHNMHAITVTLDQMEWFCKQELSVEALCFLGYFSMAKGMYKQASLAFVEALKNSTDNKVRDKIFCDLGYAYLKLDQPVEAIEAFKKISEANLKSTVGSALACFRAQVYEESYSIYGSALEWLASSNMERSSILTAMSAMVYSFQGETDAKTLLFQCLGEENPLPQSLLSACALGLLHKDTQLAELTVKELQKIDDDPHFGHHAVFLTSQFMLQQDHIRQAIVYVSNKIHSFPNRPELRRILFDILQQIRSNKSKYKTVTARLALSTVELDLSSTQKVTKSMDIAKNLALASKATQRVNLHKAKILAESAVHINPTSKEAWAAFVAVKS